MAKQFDPDFKGLTIEKVRSVQWDKSNLWDITIDGISVANGAQRFFPANDLEVGFHGITNGTVAGATLEFPQFATYPLLTLSYIDDERLSTTNAFRLWIDSIISADGFVVRPVESAKRHINIEKLNSEKKVISSWSIFAFPTGQITYHGDSDGSTPFYSVQFTVVGSNLHTQS